jgi:hypothetical protein
MTRTTTARYELIEAIRMIELHGGKQVISIGYEDGSGVKFNYMLKDETKQRFIDFSNMVDRIVTRYGTKP